VNAPGFHGNANLNWMPLAPPIPWHNSLFVKAIVAMVDGTPARHGLAGPRLAMGFVNFGVVHIPASL
jgi:hypothetical protein